VADDNEDVFRVLGEKLLRLGCVAEGKHLELQAAQGLSLVTALICQREYLTVCDGSGGVAEVTDDSDAVAL
jgi:hypothetical protein